MISSRRWLLPVAVLGTGLLATLLAALLLATADRDRDEARFSRLADGAVSAVEGRMVAQLTLLRGAAGFFNASDEVTRENFRAYVARLRLERNYPGVLGIGFAGYAPDRASLDRLVTAARADGAPDFLVTPPGDRRDYSAIVYLEPMNRRNRQALGFDMMSEPTRRAAMEASRDRGHAVMSGIVRLVQEIDPVKQPGFLIYTPLFRQVRGAGGDIREGAHYGWVYSPLRAHDLLGAIFADQDLSEITVEVFDQQISPDRLLFSSGERTQEPRHEQVRRVRIADRDWLLRVGSNPSFVGSPLTVAATVAAAGTLISFLLAFLMLRQVREAARIERKVEARTAELREANRRLIMEGQAREAAEAKIAHMQKLESIGQLTGGIAHDFNNMLTVIIGNLDSAQRRADVPQRTGRAIRHAREAAERAAELTRRLLAFGRQQALAPRVIDANALIAAMRELLERSLSEAIRLEIDLDPKAWPIFADLAQLENAILNLAINARDAMPAGGTLHIATANSQLGPDDGRAGDQVEPGDYLRITVRDTGEGMTPEVLGRALEPFFTTKEVGRGSGLGLSQVFGFVRQSGGHLGLESALGEGTRACIYLPRYVGADRPASGDKPTEAGEDVPAGKAEDVVLVVEDDERVRAMSLATLAELGYTALPASGGEEALQILKSREDIALLFTDVVMPGMSGRELAEEAWILRPELKVLFTSGYTRDPFVHASRNNGVSLIEKPFAADQLARKVRAMLDA